MSEKFLLNGERIKKRASELQEQYEKESKQFETIQSREFSFYKDLTILSGSIFGSSIALSTGKLQNSFFYWGEIFLFLSVVCSLVSLWIKIKGDYWLHFFLVKSRTQSDLTINTDIMEEFERKAIEDQLKSYDNLLKPNRLLNTVFRFIKVNWISSGGILFAIIGSLLLLLSLFNIHFKIFIPSFSITIK